MQSGGRTTADDETDNSDHRAKYVTMRLCVLNVDVKKILAADFWPISVTVRPWVFKSRQQQGNPRSNTYNNNDDRLTAFDPGQPG